MRVVYLNYDENWVPMTDERGDHYADVSGYLLWFLAKGIDARIDKERYCALVTNNFQILLYYDHETREFKQ